jgi:hypothetical protein
MPRRIDRIFIEIAVEKRVDKKTVDDGVPITDRFSLRAANG